MSDSLTHIILSLGAAEYGDDEAGSEIVRLSVPKAQSSADLAQYPMCVMWTLKEVGKVIPWKEGHRCHFKRYRSAGANGRLSTNWSVERA